MYGKTIYYEIRIVTAAAPSRAESIIYASRTLYIYIYTSATSHICDTCTTVVRRILYSVLLMRNYRAERFPGFGTFYDLGVAAGWASEKNKSNNRAEVDLENNRVRHKYIRRAESERETETGESVMCVVYYTDLRTLYISYYYYYYYLHSSSGS